MKSSNDSLYKECMSIQAQLTAAAAVAAGAATMEGSAGTVAGKSPIEEAATHSEASAKGKFMLAHHLMRRLRLQIQSH